MPRASRWVRAVLWLSNLHRRLLPAYFALLGPRAAYAVTGTLARWLYRLLPPFRRLSEAQCGAALGNQVRPQDVPRVAEQAFVHRIWNLTDLFLAERLLHAKTYDRFGGRIPEPHRSKLLAAQQRRQPALLVSAYYGPFDLLPVFLGFDGVRAGAVYLPHANPGFDAQRRRARARGGCELISIERALARLPEILVAGGTVALIADHHTEHRGLPATFLGLPTHVPRSVGWLAWRYNADVVVAGIRRVNCAFHFAIEVMDVIDHSEWAGRGDAVAYITDRYLRGLERLVRCDPTQYLWGYARWGEQFARELISDANGRTDDRSTKT